MGIWLDEIEASVRQMVNAALRDRRMLRLALEDRYTAAHDGSGPDCALLLLEACSRTGEAFAPDEAETLLHAEVARQIYPGFKLRGGQAALLVPGPVDAAQIKRLLQRIQLQLAKATAKRLALAFGAARALEARRGVGAWIALADLRLKSREQRLDLQGTPAPAMPGERRRSRAAADPAPAPRTKAKPGAPRAG